MSVIAQSELLEVEGRRSVYTSIAVTEQLVREMDDDGLAAMVGREAVLQIRKFIAEEDQRNG